LIFRRFLSPRPDGPLNFLVGLVGIPPQKWLIDVSQALPSIVGISLWEAFGYFMVIWLAGLQSIPDELYAAAKVDGADGWRLHRHITIPLLRPTAAFIIVISTIGALQIFGSFGYASALSVLFFAIILIITLIQSRYLRFGDEIY